MAKKRSGRKVRVDFRQNRAQPRRQQGWTRRFHAGSEDLGDERSSESVRPKGELSRKRTILVDENQAALVEESRWKRGVVTVIHGQVCHVDADGGGLWDCSVRRVLRTRLIEQRNAVTVGDTVWFSAISETQPAGEPAVGVIERVEPRRTLLSRGARVGHDARRGGHRRQHLIAANVDQILIVGSAAQPAIKPHLIDRYLVAAVKGDVRPVICINKCDLLPETPQLDAEQSGVERLLAVDEDAEEGINVGFMDLIGEYQGLGYKVILSSASRGDGLDELREELRDRKTVVSGQSGVGKSSLLNAIQPGLALRVQEVSEETEKGRHTTTHAQLLKLDFGGYVVDTPGIRAFDLWDVEPGELEACFVEFGPYLSRCRFNDCHHRTEDEGCAVLAAVNEGEIGERRYLSYLKMLTEVSRPA